MLIKYCGPKEVKTVEVDGNILVFEKKKGHTVEIPDHHPDHSGTPSNECKFFLSPDRRGLFKVVKSKEKKIKESKQKKESKK